MWTMRCMLCPAGDGGTWVDLVRIQEHAMYEHGYSRVDLRNNTRRPGSRTKDHFIWPHRAGIALRGGAGLGLRLAKTIRFWKPFRALGRSFGVSGAHRLPSRYFWKGYGVRTLRLASVGLLGSLAVLWTGSYPCLHCVPVIGSLLRLFG